jgi:hypothetical protein
MVRVQGTRVPVTVARLPLPVRSAVLGAMGMGVLGCVAGLVIGLRVYAPTAWAATFEVGIPATVLGAVIGLAVGAAISWSSSSLDFSDHEE